MAKKKLIVKKKRTPPIPAPTMVTNGNERTYLVYTQSKDATEPQLWVQVYGPDKEPIILRAELEHAKAIIANMAKGGSKLRWRLFELVAEYV